MPVLNSSMLHTPPTKYHLPAAKQKPYLKAYLLTNKNKNKTKKKKKKKI